MAEETGQALAERLAHQAVARRDDEIGVLAFPDIEACRKLAGRPAETPPAAILSEPKLRERLRSLLSALAKESTGSSTRVARMMLLAEPPSFDAGEATDKGSINQRAVLTRRVALVEELYAPTKSANVISVDDTQ